MMRFVCSYMRKRVKNVFAFVGTAAIFAVIFYLYDLPVEAVGYASLLSAVFLIFILAVRIARAYEKQKDLDMINHSILITQPCFPEKEDATEQKYQEMIERLFEYKTELEGAVRIGRQDMMDYYGMWAHQIKTPISAMRLLLQSKEGEPSVADKELRMELFKIEQYVEMVLSYVRMEDITSDLVLQWYSVDDIIRQAVRKYAQMFIMKKITLEFSESNQKVLTDEKWLLFVLEQILSNALKYTKEGSIRIYVQETDSVTLVVEDTGIGIWEEDIPRVFEKGFTGYNGRTDKKSTGIGLYLCKRILDKLRHHITIESEVGTGTRVSIGLSREEIKYE